MDTALSLRTLKGVADGTMPSHLFRLHVPSRIVAFGRQDTHAAGFATAVAACRATGFAPVVRLAGGRAAVFHEETLAFAWQQATAEPKVGIRDRFEACAEFFVLALARLGIKGEIGEVPGEYCPGKYSIHVDGKKVVGIGQRLINGAAHVGGVVVAGRSDRVNLALNEVYPALGLTFDPAATGELGCSTVELQNAISVQLAESFDVVAADFPATLIDDASARVAEHRPRSV